MRAPSRLLLLLSLSAAMLTGASGPLGVPASRTDTPALPGPSRARPAEVGGVPYGVAQEIWQIELLRLPVASLAPMLQDRSPAIRARAARAIGRLRESGTSALLAPSLADTDARVRREAAVAMGWLEGSANAVAARWRVEDDPEVRAALAGALGRQGGAEAVDILVEALGTRAAVAAADGLGRLGMRKVEAARGDRVVAALLDVVADPLRFDARRRAAWALARMSLPRTSDDNLLQMRNLLFAEGDAQVRAGLMRAWVPLASEAARAEILPTTARDPDAAVRIATARAIERAPFEGARAMIQDLLEDPVANVRVEAVTAAPAVAEGDALRALLAPAFNAVDPVERAAAVRAMASKRVLPIAAATFLDPSNPMVVRIAAAESLEDRAQLMKLALEAPEPPVRSAAASVLLDGPVPPSFAEIRAILLGADLELAQAAADALAEHPDPGGEQALLELLKRADLPDATAESAVRALVAVYGTGKVRRPGAEAAERVRPLLSRPRLAEEAQRLAAILKIPVPPRQHPTRKVPELAEALEIRSARIFTSSGEIRLQLLPEEAPYTVWNFARLAESGAFDGVSFHRVIPDFVIQTGDPRGDGWGGPGYEIPDELNAVPYETGTLGMALSGPDTGGSQWFITLSPQPHLDGSYTAFGRVVSGMHAARAIARGARVERVVIERVPFGSATARAD